MNFLPDISLKHFTWPFFFSVVPLLFLSFSAGFFTTFLYFIPFNQSRLTHSEHDIYYSSHIIIQIGSLLGTILYFTFHSFSFGFRRSLFVAYIMLLTALILTIIGTFVVDIVLKWIMMASGCLMAGTGVGLTIIMVPLLLSDLSTLEIRGSMTYLHSLFFFFGISFSQLGTNSPQTAWDASIFAFLGSLLFIEAFLIRLIPESPVWLVDSNRRMEAEEILSRLRPEKSAIDLKRELDHLQLLKLDETSSWKELIFRSKVALVGLLLTAMMLALTVISILESLADSKYNFINVLISIFSILFCVWSVDRFGRRSLLLATVLIASISAIVTSVYLITSSGPKELKECIGGLSLGPTSVIWPLLCEIYPIRMRSYGLVFSLVLKSLMGIIASCEFRSEEWLPNNNITDREKSDNEIWLFSSLSLALVALVAFFLTPETKKKTLLDIQCYFYPKIRLGIQMKIKELEEDEGEEFNLDRLDSADSETTL
eukprot:TRINITY_DN12881_c0_g1_i1.p1 TRINITY_DN12881_c0_g1~~TRINITY_DN12881_c0_g1_i1.p1  ORF type:complete len:496 (+),score=75.02 TRINITY_DN12881_c0_g1_i1:37-1488(+)